MRRLVMGLVITIAMVTATGCEIAGTTAPAIEPRLVVHSVLNPGGGVQLVIVEKSLRSTVRSTDGTVPYEPIGDARVVIHGPRGDSVVATPANGTGATVGVYRMSSITVTDGSAGNAGPNVLRLRPGERYELRVETSIGTARGETIIPVGGPIDGTRRTFNLDHDTLRISTAGVRSAAGYYLRHETTSAFHERYVAILDDVLILPLTGDPKWAFSFARESVYPGLAQRFSVVAVDSNYFKYYVAGFDPFGDDTRGNTLTGGVGLFGAVATIMSKTMDLTADIDTPIEGLWGTDGTPRTLPTLMTLYSSPYFPGGQFPQRFSLTGTALIGGAVHEAYGVSEIVGATIQFVSSGQNGQTSAATADVQGGDLVLTDTRTGERVTYHRR